MKKSLTFYIYLFFPIIVLSACHGTAKTAVSKTAVKKYGHGDPRTLSVKDSHLYKMKYKPCASTHDTFQFERAFGAFYKALMENEWQIQGVIPADGKIYAKKCQEPKFCAEVAFYCYKSGIIEGYPLYIQPRVLDDLERWHGQLVQLNSQFRCHEPETLIAELNRHGYYFESQSNKANESNHPDSGDSMTAIPNTEVSNEAPSGTIRTFTHCSGLTQSYVQDRAFSSFLMALKDREWIIDEMIPSTSIIIAKKCHEKNVQRCTEIVFQNDKKGRTHAVPNSPQGLSNEELSTLLLKLEQSYSEIRCYKDEILKAEMEKYGFSFGEK